MFSELTITQIVIVFGSIILSMGVHEAVHAFVAHSLGDRTAHDLGRLTLNPLAHIDIYTTVLLPLVLILVGAQPFFIAKPVPFNPLRVKYEEYGWALIGVAGPLTNFVLAVVASLILRAIGGATGTQTYDIFSIFIQVNLGMFVFNMIPFPPLDGSRLLYAFAPEPLQKIMYQIESAGLTAILIFMFLLFPVLGPLVGNTVETLYNFLLM